MAKSRNNHIRVTIKDQSGEVERLLHADSQLTVGRLPSNDILVYDRTYPRSQSMIQCSKDQCTIFLHPSMSGQLRYQDTELSLRNLIVQDVLPQKGGFYIIKVLPGHCGVINVGEYQVHFSYTSESAQFFHFPDFSWRSATRKSLLKDGVFKLLLILFLSFEGWWIYHINHTDLPPEQPPQSQQAQKRFARFIIRDQEPEPELSATDQGSLQSAGTLKENEPTAEEKPAERAAGQRRDSGPASDKVVESAGLLGIIGGSGNSRQSSQAIDFLIDKGVADNLDKVMQTQRLQKGKRIGSGSGDDGSGSGDMLAIDELLAMGVSSNVDDIVASNSDMESVRLEKKGNINIQTPQSISGSSQAKADRSAQNVMSVINSQHGRIMYTYNKYLRQDPSLGGKITLDVTIEASGRVSLVRIAESNISNSSFIAEVIGIIKRLRFKPISSGSVTVNLPFVFHRN